MKKIIYVLILLVGFSGCDYLDIVPDDKPTLNDAFKNEYETENFLYSVYSFIPQFSNFRRNIAWATTDEISTSP